MKTSKVHQKVRNRQAAKRAVYGSKVPSGEELQLHQISGYFRARTNRRFKRTFKQRIANAWLQARVHYEVQCEDRSMIVAAAKSVRFFFWVVR